MEADEQVTSIRELGVTPQRRMPDNALMCSNKHALCVDCVGRLAEPTSKCSPECGMLQYTCPVCRMEACIDNFHLLSSRSARGQKPKNAFPAIMLWVHGSFASSRQSAPSGRCVGGETFASRTFGGAWEGCVGLRTLPKALGFRSAEGLGALMGSVRVRVALLMCRPKTGDETCCLVVLTDGCGRHGLGAPLPA